MRYNKQLTAEECDQIYDHMAQNNTLKYNRLKAAEELQELALVLVQKVNKPEKISDQQIIDEIGDVKIRLEVLQRLFSSDEINKRINNKLNQFQRFIESEKHKNI
jgi:hypothetical protein